MQGLTTFWTLFIMRHASILPAALSSVLYQCSKALMLALWFLSSSNHPLCLDKITVECSSTAIVKQKLVVVVSTKERPIPSDECDEGNYNLGPHSDWRGSGIEWLVLSDPLEQPWPFPCWHVFMTGCSCSMCCHSEKADTKSSVHGLW